MPPRQQQQQQQQQQRQTSSNNRMVNCNQMYEKIVATEIRIGNVRKQISKTVISAKLLRCEEHLNFFVPKRTKL